MRILFLNYEYPPLGGGSATASRSLVRAWTALGCEVRVVTSHFRGLPWHEPADGARLHRLPVLRRRQDRGRIAEMSLYMAGASLYALALALIRRPDVVIAFNGIPSGPVAWGLRWLLGLPYILALRGGEVPGFRCEGVEGFHRRLGPFIRLTWRHAARVTANSDGLADLARRFAPEIPVTVIANGVDCDRFRPAPTPDAAPANGPVRLLTVGRLVWQKGLDVLLAALARPGLETLELEIVGDGERRPDLERQAEALGLAGRVRFLGWLDRDRLAEVYRRADLFVLPSRDEGMPNVVLEAMACGLPVIGTQIAGTRDMVIEDQTGLLVPPDDPEALAAALGRLATGPETRRSLGAAGRQRAEHTYAWTTAAEAYLEMAKGCRPSVPKT